MGTAAVQRVRDTNPHLGHKDDVIKDHLRLVHMVIRKYTKVAINQGISYEDLYSEGCIGLLKAFDKYDPTKFEGKVTKFSTYAVPMILGEVQRFLRDKGRLIRTPRAIALILPRVMRMINDGYSTQKIANELQCDEENILAVLDYQRESNAIALDQPIHSFDNENLTVMDQVGTIEDFSGAYMNEILERLSEREQTVVKLRMDGYEQREIGQRIGLSQVQVSRILAQIRDQIKEFSNQYREEDEIVERVVEVDKSLLTKETYLTLSVSNPDYKIANQFNISAQTLVRWKKEWGIDDRRKNPAKTTGTQQLSDIPTTNRLDVAHKQTEVKGNLTSRMATQEELKRHGVKTILDQTEWFLDSKLPTVPSISLNKQGIWFNASAAKAMELKAGELLQVGISKDRNHLVFQKGEFGLKLKLASSRDALQITNKRLVTWLEGQRIKNMQYALEKDQLTGVWTSKMETAAG